jgi:hypothetical protein
MGRQPPAPNKMLKGRQHLYSETDLADTTVQITVLEQQWANYLNAVVRVPFVELVTQESCIRRHPVRISIHN